MSSMEENNNAAEFDRGSNGENNTTDSLQEMSTQGSSQFVAPTRIKEMQKQHIRRPKRKSDSGESMKKRNQKRKLNQNAKIPGNFRFYAESEAEKIDLCNKLDRAKMMVDETIANTSNFTILNHILDNFLKTPGTQNNVSATDGASEFKQYLYREYDDNRDDELYICTPSALANISFGIQDHSKNCSSDLSLKDIQRFGHVGKLLFECNGGHELKCDTSSHLEGGSFVANMKVVHSVYSSGLRHAQYERFCTGAGLGSCSETVFKNSHNMFCEIIEAKAKESIHSALNGEIAQSVANMAEQGDEYEGVDIITDARHGWRKNAAQSDVVALGNITHKVVNIQTVTRSDEPISQRHELVGVKKMYKDFDRQNVKVRIHGHDRNSSVNKYLAQEKPNVKNANDTWHATKGITKILKNITTGAKKNRGITWHEELADKAASIKTACFYAMKSCNGNPDKLREILDNIPRHYQDDHAKCLPESRCKTDEEYECSKCPIRDPVAIRLLTDAIRKLQIYRTPADYACCVDTHYVESYNNATLVYHDKRISFGEKEYKRRTYLSVLDWNENVDRDYTSVSEWEDAKAPRRKTGRKNLKPKSFTFVGQIWAEILNRLYQRSNSIDTESTN